MNDIRRIFEFTTYLEGFKKMERYIGQVFWRDYPQQKRYESNADHTWRMAMMLTVLESKLSEPLDFKRAMKMLLIHDIPEMIAGDPSPMGSDGTGQDSHAYNKDVAAERFDREAAAAQEIFAKLPEDQAQELYALWLEFEEQSSYEARVVKALDKLEAKFQVFEYTKGREFPQHHEFNKTYGVPLFSADPAIEALWEVVLKEMQQHYTPYQK